MAIIFGLDFGTSNSSLSINIDGKVETKQIDCFNKEGDTLKSVIYYNPEDKKMFVGHEAVNEYIENDAYGRYIQSVKSFLPDINFISTEIGGKSYKLEELIALILRNIKNKGEAFVDCQVDDVVLGRPVIFSEDSKREKVAQERLICAAKLAGFKNVYMQYEPIAAALSYESTLKDNDEKIVLVGDFGGGTSDFTIIKVRGCDNNKKRDRKDDILSLGGVYIGGDTFDSLLMWEKVAKHFGKDVRIKSIMSNNVMGMSPLIMGHLKKWHLIPQLRKPRIFQSIQELRMQADNPKLIENLINLIEDNYGYMLFRAIEKTKINLSSSEFSKIIYNDLKVKVNERVERSEFNEIIKVETKKIATCVNEVLKKAELKPEMVDVVFLTGGSSYIPVIKNIFKEKFGEIKIKHKDAFTSVGYGLGIYGNMFI